MGTCSMCGMPLGKVKTRSTCQRCEDGLVAQARAEQEKAYLASWLSSRVDAKGFPLEDTALTVGNMRLIKRLVKEARRIGAEWNNPPAPIIFDKRLAAVKGRAPATPRRKKAA